MKFGIVFANSGPAAHGDYASGLAQAAEGAGFESVWTIEHVVVPAGYASAYPYSADGRMPGGEDVDMPDPLIWLAYVAAATTRLRLGTGILILPQRNPVIVAKEAATLDLLSGGRLELGVGVGWMREEFDALGVPFAHRGSRTDEYVAALRALWAEDVASFRGEFTSFDRVKSFPKPVQTGGVPIVVGGHTPAAARRAGRLGDGFFPAGGGLDELPALLSEMRDAAATAGRNADAIEITAGGATDLEGVKRAADLGVSRLVIPAFGRDLERVRRRLEVFSDAVISPSA
ncbi:MAG: LLM class F420-dependent oxidoreductase [Acidimicrobiales bacterium]